MNPAVVLSMAATNPTVLVVEDEPLILLHSRLALEDAGFAVLTAADADEALKTMAERRDIATLFTDVNIPGTMDGLALAETARHRRPEMAIFITSGVHRLEDDALPRGARFLPKPYTAAQVSRLLCA